MTNLKGSAETGQKNGRGFPLPFRTVQMRSVLEHQAINQNRLMLSFLTGRAGFCEKPDSTFSPGALADADEFQIEGQIFACEMVVCVECDFVF